MKRIIAALALALIPAFALVGVEPALAGLVRIPYALDAKTSQTTGVTGAAIPLFWTSNACAGRLSVTSGSGTMNVKIQYSPDGGTTWFDELAFLSVTGASNQVVHVDTTTTRQYPVVRSVSTISGTFTYAVYLDCD